MRSRLIIAGVLLLAGLAIAGSGDFLSPYYGTMTSTATVTNNSAMRCGISMASIRVAAGTTNTCTISVVNNSITNIILSEDGVTDTAIFLDGGAGYMMERNGQVIFTASDPGAASYTLFTVDR